jgi:hypothetical protein
MIIIGGDYHPRKLHVHRDTGELTKARLPSPRVKP